MNFDLPSLQYFFKLAYKIGVAQHRIQDISQRLENDWDDELPVKESFILQIVEELNEVNTFLTKIGIIEK